MSDLGDFLTRLVRALEGANIPYMLAGSLASAFYGMPRTTQDVDIVLELSLASSRSLLAAFRPDDYYIDEGAVREAILRRGQFNIIDMATGWKADLIVRKLRPFSEEEFQRRVKVMMLGVEIAMATPEDVVLSKLEWSLKSGSERQLRDVVGIILTCGGTLDKAYIDVWAATLGVAGAWAEAQDQARSVQR